MKCHDFKTVAKIHRHWNKDLTIFIKNFGRNPQILKKITLDFLEHI